MIVFFGRPWRMSWVLSLILLAPRAFAQDSVPPPQSSTSAAPSDASAQHVDAAPTAQQAPATTDGAATKPAQMTPAEIEAAKAEHAKADQEAPPDKRVLGVLPNYRTINETGTYEPIDTKHKLIIACKDSFDYPLVLLGGAFAGISQLANSDPSYHQGVEGYAKRLAANYADQAIGNMMTEGFFPAFLHEDPRYRRLGASRGSKGYRTWYAFSRIFVTRTDSGTTRFNYSEWAGNATGVAISNLYHPDGRDWSDNTFKLLEQCATDGISQILKEFWPDIKHKFFHKNPPGSD